MAPLLALVLIAGAWFVYTFNLKAYVETALTQALGAQVRIQSFRIGGLSRVTVEGVSVERDSQRIAGLGRLHIVASSWGILRRKIVIDTLEVVAPALHLRRDAEGHWNFPILNAPVQSAKDPWSWVIEVRHGTLRDGAASLTTVLPDSLRQVSVDSLTTVSLDRTGADSTLAVLPDSLRQVSVDSLTTVSLDSLNLDFGIRPEERGHTLLLSRLNSVLLSPPLVIRRVEATAFLRGDSLNVSAFDLETEASHLRLTGRVRRFSDPQVDLVLEADPLSSDEVRRFLPAFSLTGPLALTASVKGEQDTMDIATELRTQGGSVEGRGHVNLAAEPVSYDIVLTTRNIDLARLLPDSLTPTDLNLSLSVSGKGLSAKEADLSGVLVISGSSFGEAAFDSSVARVRLKDGLLDAEAQVRLQGWGDLRGEGHLELTATPLRYRVNADVTDLNLASALKDTSLQSDLSGSIEISGSGVVMDSLDAEVLLTLRPSRIAGQRFDGFEAEGRYRERVLSLGRLALRSPAGEARGTGQVTFPPDQLLTYDGEIVVSGLDLARVTGDTTLRSDLNATVTLAGKGGEEMDLRLEGHPSKLLGIPIDRFTAGGDLRQGVWNVEQFNLESQAVNVVLTGTLGPSDSIDVRAELHARQLLPTRSLNLALSGDVTGTLRGRLEDLHVVAEGHADSLASGTTVLRDATFDMDLGGLNLRRPDAGLDRAVFGDVTVRVGSLALSSFVLDDLIAGAHLTPGIADLALNVAPADWALVDAAGRVTFSPEGFVARLDTLSVDARKFRVQSVGQGELRYTYGGPIRLERLRMVQEGGELTASGVVEEDRVRFEARLQGIDLKRWEDLLGRQDGVSGKLDISATASGRLEDPEVSGAVEIVDGKVSDFAYKRLAGTFEYRRGVGMLDLRLDQGGVLKSKELTLQGFVPLPMRPDGPFDVHVRTEGLDLSFLQAAFSDLQDVEGSLRGDLTLRGTMRRPVLSGFLEIPSGSLRIPSLGLRLRETKMRLDAAPDRVILSGLKLRTKDGSLEGGGEVGLDGLRVKDFKVEVEANKFDALDRKDAQLSLSGTLRLTGTPIHPGLNFDVMVHRALIPLPEEEAPAGSPSIYDSEFIQGMTGRGHLRVPRNAWVRSSDFNAEVQGELDVEKEGSVFILFGELNAIRGQYIFQNARFSIARGELRFRGLANEDPEIYLVGVRRLARVLPDASGKLTQDLTVSIVVGGTLNKPQISLESDAPMPLDQADILSYALFGRPSSQALLAPFGGGGGTGGGFQSQAQSLVVGMTANRLKQTVGRELGLDVLELEMGSNTLTHLAIGKYVSQDLLLTFNQDLIEAGGQGQDRLGRKVSAEYEFSRNIGLIGSVDDQKKTSLDLFWKKEW